MEWKENVRSAKEIGHSSHSILIFIYSIVVFGELVNLHDHSFSA